MSRWVLVTGGAKRLGRDVALELAKSGFSVAVHYLSLDQDAESTASDCKDFGVQSATVVGDLSTIDGARLLAQQVKADIGHVYGIINCVGQSISGTVLETPLEQAEQLFIANILSPIALVQEMIEELKSQKGAIVNIGSSGILPVGGEVPYCNASKEALFQITRSLALDLAPSGVRVNMISPAASTSLVACPGIDTVAQTAAYLISDQAAGITGQHIEVMRGRT